MLNSQTAHVVRILHFTHGFEVTKTASGKILEVTRYGKLSTMVDLLENGAKRK